MISNFFRSLRRVFVSSQRLFRPRRYSTGIRTLHHTTGSTIPKWSQLRHISKILSPQERMLLRGALMLLIIGVCWLGASLVRGYRIEVPARGGSYVEAIVGSPELINPLFASLNDADRDIVRLVYSGLMRFNKAGNLVPDLAANVQISEDSTVYTFELRKDVVWHDGEMFTAKDVLFTFDMIQNESVGSPLYLTFQNIAVETIDDYTVQFTLNEPFAPFLQSLTVGILPEHVWATIEPERFSLAQRNLQPVGTGPFQFSRFTKSTTGSIFEYELRRFERYYRELAYIGTVTFRYFPVYEGDAGAIRALRGQSVDALHFVPSDLREQVTRKHITLHTLQLPQYTALFFNPVRKSALQDSTVREAFALALDKERIVREVLRGEGQVIEGPILPGFPGYSEDIPQLGYDIAAANALLDKNWSIVTADEYIALRRAEITDQLMAQREREQQNIVSTTVSSTLDQESITSTIEQSPIVLPPITTSSVAADVELILSAEIDPSQTFYRKNKDGNLLEINIVTVDTDEYKRAAALIEASWQEIGVTVQVAFVPAREFTRSVLRDRSYDVLLYGIILGSDPDQYPFWHSSQVHSPGLNLSLYKNNTVDTLLDTARNTSDEEKIASTYASIQEQILADRPAIFLYTPTYTYAQSTAVRGFNISHIFVPSDRFINITEWYVRTRGIWKKDA